ncbi:TAP domain protein [Kribbella flavida DSM 17836]|uniref:TAP domain protein n=1 Tax=Kribbella flavida (strain DSM 17836 / JCM 10339 / NBRC 14399) TaxID=479435 RepID=D2PYH1_KRIFD|nr:alpha/beta hydrolase [Kribbella flavida]ADB35539.1 TAP domain protein [Kribbella flavida DSM 17836]
MATFDAFLTRLDVKPLPTERSTPLRRSGVLASLTIGFSDPPLWSRLSDALAAAYAGQGEALQGFADAFTGRRADGSFSNFAVVNAAVNCLDHPDRLTVDTVRAAMPAFARASPRFGQLTGMLLLTCAQWPFPGVGRERPIDGEGAAPIVVLGNTGDPLGRYAWAEELAGRLDSGVLLRWDGTGHGAYGGIDRCVDDRVGAYLLDGTVPARTHCPG